MQSMKLEKDGNTEWDVEQCIINLAKYLNWKKE